MTELTEPEKELIQRYKPGGQSSAWAMAPLYAAVAAIIDARLAPIRALADLLIEQGDEHVDGCEGQADCAACVHHDLLAALDATGADLSASQDHDGTEGQGEDERAAGGDDGFLDYILDRSCPCGPHGEVHP